MMFGLTSLVAAGAATLLLAFPATAQSQQVTRHELSNGLRVLVREDPSVRLVAISLQTLAGSRLEPAGSAGITNFMQRVMLRGTGRWTATTLAETAERIGGAIDATADVDYTEVRGTALSRHWDRLLQIVADVALDPTFPAGEVETERRLILGQLQTRADTPFPLVFDALMQDLYGEHPYAVTALGRKETVSRLTREDLKAHHLATYRSERMALAISGAVDRRAVLRAVEKLFAARARLPAPEPQVMASVARASRRREIEGPAQQAQVVVGYLAPSVGDPDYPAVRVLSTVLGGGMAGRLFVQIRDAMGLAYSLGVVNPMRLGPAYLVAYLGTARDNLAAAEAATLHELERMRVEGPTDGEVARARAYLLGNLVLDRRTNARHAWYLAFFELAGLGWDFPDRYAEALKAVTTSQVKAAASRYLTDPTVVTLRPR
jgi:predicted Zn-dependent peptidase